jgi:hypothetical protein
MSARSTPGWLREVLLVQPDAGRAADALQQQRGLADAVGTALDEAGLHLGAVVHRQFRQRNSVGGPGRHGCRRAGGVESGQAASQDGLRDRLAARAAEIARRTVDHRDVPTGLRDWQSTMEAGLGGR